LVNDWSTGEFPKPIDAAMLLPGNVADDDRFVGRQRPRAVIQSRCQSDIGGDFKCELLTSSRSLPQRSC
jgi:hypothetical protein